MSANKNLSKEEREDDHHRDHEIKEGVGIEEREEEGRATKPYPLLCQRGSRRVRPDQRHLN